MSLMNPEGPPRSVKSEAARGARQHKLGARKVQRETATAAAAAA
jgi:hypothetical protein